jgi:hypothetical protein
MDCSTPSAPFYTAQSFGIKNCSSCWPTILRLRSAPTRLWTYVGPTPYSGLCSIYTAQGIDIKNCLSCWPNCIIDYAPTPSAPSYTAQGFDIKKCLSCWPTIQPLRSAPTRQLINTGSIPTCQLPHACGLMLAPFPVAAPHGPQNYGLRHDYFGPIEMKF